MRESSMSWSVYQPALMDEETRRRRFIAHQPRLQTLLTELRDHEGGRTPQHHLVVGRAGMGKTLLLHRLADVVREDKQLKARFVPVLLSQSWDRIQSAQELWSQTESLLNEELLERGDSATNLVEFLKGEGSGTPDLLFLMDDADEALAKLDEEQWAIREVLSGSEKIHFIGTSTRFLESTYDYGAAFYDFFRSHTLESLDEAEALAVLNGHLEEEGKGGLVDSSDYRPLAPFVGRSPRALALLAREWYESQDLWLARKRVLDRWTPAFEARLESLSPLSRSIIAAVASGWHPQTAGEVGAALDLPSNKVSAYLGRLVKEGHVDKVTLPPGKSIGYQLSDRSWNLWFLMRDPKERRLEDGVALARHCVREEAIEDEGFFERVEGIARGDGNLDGVMFEGRPPLLGKEERTRVARVLEKLEERPEKKISMSFNCKKSSRLYLLRILLEALDESKPELLNRLSPELRSAARSFADLVVA